MSTYHDHFVRQVEEILLYLSNNTNENNDHVSYNKNVREILKANAVGYSLNNSAINVLLPDLKERFLDELYCFHFI
jgi:hypothetical protein